MKVFLVGGCIRDDLLGLEPKDFDFCVVGATPQELLEWHPELKQVGADFPVFIDNNGTEFALARTERKVHSGYNGFKVDYNPDITLEEDLGRRDLTINAMAREVDYDPKCGAWNITSTLIDPYNGQQDLKDGILRHTTEDFKEDPVRVLRVARFRARYGFEIHHQTQGFISNMAQMGELKHLTAERVFMEVDKALQEPFPELFFNSLDDYARGVIFPEFGLLGEDLIRIAGLREASRLSRWAAAFFNECSLEVLDTMKVPNNIRTVINDTRLLPVTREQYGATSVRIERAEILVQTLLQLKAHQKPQRLNDVVAFMPLTCQPPLMHFADMLMEACHVINRLDVSHITSSDVLCGPDIGHAIHSARVTAVAEMFS